MKLFGYICHHGTCTPQTGNEKGAGFLPFTGVRYITKFLVINSGLYLRENWKVFSISPFIKMLSNKITVMTEPAFFLETDRLCFRKWCREDIDYAIGLWGDFKVTKLFDNRGQLNDRQVRVRLLQEIENQERYNVQYWPVFSKQKAVHVGAAGLRPKDLKENQYEIGFQICSKYWNMGYGREATQGVLEYAFNTLGASSLFAGHNPSNKISEIILTKLKFEYTHDEYYVPTHLMHPSYILTSASYNNRTQNAKQST